MLLRLRTGVVENAEQVQLVLGFRHSQITQKRPYRESQKYSLDNYYPQVQTQPYQRW